jgi:hypothetical protein
MDSPITKMKRAMRSKLRRGRGQQGFTTISGMLQGMKQKARSGLVAAKNSDATIRKGAEINKIRNRITGLKNRISYKNRNRNRIPRRKL